MMVMSRLERLDLMLVCLEEIKAGQSGGGSGRWSSGVSTTSSGCQGTVKTIEGESSSPKKKNGCRSIEEALVETQLKGSLIDRIILLESRLLKLEEGIEYERKKEIEEISPKSSGNKKHKKGLKSIVKSCVKGDLKTKG